jgi:hypothetical protein
MEKFGTHILFLFLLFLFLLFILTKQPSSSAFSFSKTMVDEEVLNERQYHVQKSMTNYEYDHAPSSYFTETLFIV